MMDKAEQLKNKVAESDKTQEYIDKAGDKAGDKVDQGADMAKDAARKAGGSRDQDESSEKNSGQ